MKKAFESLNDSRPVLLSPACCILISLADSPKHGYAMTQDIEAVSGAAARPGHALRRDCQLERASGSSHCRPTIAGARTA
jgi:hypothetical protein